MVAVRRVTRTLCCQREAKRIIMGEQLWLELLVCRVELSLACTLMSPSFQSQEPTLGVKWVLTVPTSENSKITRP